MARHVNVLMCFTHSKNDYKSNVFYYFISAYYFMLSKFSLCVQVQLTWKCTQFLDNADWWKLEIRAKIISMRAKGEHKHVDCSTKGNMFKKEILSYHEHDAELLKITLQCQKKGHEVLRQLTKTTATNCMLWWMLTLNLWFF